MQTGSAVRVDVAVVEGPGLEHIYGPFMHTSALWRLMSYPSPDAFSKAASRGKLPVKAFRLPHRRGWFASTADVTRWLISVDAGVVEIEGPPT